MAVDTENMRQLMGWLADGSPARAHTAADALVSTLAAVVFDNDGSWPDHADGADGYRNALQAWFATDSGRESQFAALTAPGADPGTCFDWLLPVVREWQQWAAHVQADATQGGEGQASPEERRYSERTRDPAYGLDYRLDLTTGAYEWYDEATATWRDQTWANEHTAATRQAAAAPVPSAGAQPEWDENWKMFYRISSGGAYEFADAVSPGDRSSGSTDHWLSQEQVLARTAQGPAGAGQSAAPEAALSAAVEAAIDRLVAADERFAAIPEERRRQLAAEVLRDQAAAR